MTAHLPTPGRPAGVSLVEALVALAVMAFGMLGMAGIQSTLRANSDVARQRSEAVRIAQETIERARSYTIAPTVATPSAARVYFDALTSVPAATVTGYTTNTSYTRTVSVATSTPQNYKTYVVDVAWRDRSDTPYQVRLSTVIHRSPPELAAALAIPGVGTVPGSPGGRNPSIPRSAIDQGDGTSNYTPPDSGAGTYLRFGNDTGLITRVCISGVCTSVTARFVAGFIHFATGTSAPGPADAESPPGAAFAVSATVSQSFPSSGVPAPQCFTETPGAPTSPIAYACVVHVDPASALRWSGQVLLTGLALASSATDTSGFRVCRYTPYRSNVTVGSAVPGVTPAVTMQNHDHPLAYSLVDRNYEDRNFLVIRASDGAPTPTAFACPSDNTSTPFVNTNTYDHQPSAGAP